MATYGGITRTNYFRVIDPKKLEKIISMVDVDWNELKSWTHEAEGITYYAFGGYCTIYGMQTEEFAEGLSYADYDAFCKALQEVVYPGDAIIITEVGNENLRYLKAFSTVITHDHVEIVWLQDEALACARRLLGQLDYSPQMDR